MAHQYMLTQNAIEEIAPSVKLVSPQKHNATADSSCQSLDNQQDGQHINQTILIASYAEFKASIARTFDRPLVVASMNDSSSCHVEVFDDCSAGELIIPAKQRKETASTTVGFYLDAHRLVLIDDTDMCMTALERTRQTYRSAVPTLGMILFAVLHRVIDGDASYLESLESLLETTEERIIQMDRLKMDRSILGLLRHLLNLSYYYQQLGDVGVLLEENTNGILSAEDLRLFGIFTRHVDRLFDRTNSFKEYCLQLIELQQTQIDVHQNTTMQWLTVVTSIFVPLTLLTSWYGMNFQNMPELSWPFGYAIVIVIALIIIIVELFFFHRRGWL
ncbi:MAG: magnesium transporter CorA [Eggerthellaceae bacterium]|jgi:magnesium transporter|nr:magnesium transporter CorA [Eggerthellaceae bacterium]